MKANNYIFSFLAHLLFPEVFGDSCSAYLERKWRQRPLSFIGEEPHWRVIRSMGYDEELARTFMLWGCYEWAIRDSANDTNAAEVNLLKPVSDRLAGAVAGRFSASGFVCDILFSVGNGTVANCTVSKRGVAMEFCGRENEIGELRKVRATSRKFARFTVVTGRRRIGKTQLIRQALDDGESPYVQDDVCRA